MCADLTITCLSRRDSAEKKLVPYQMEALAHQMPNNKPAAGKRHQGVMRWLRRPLCQHPDLLQCGKNKAGGAGQQHGDAQNQTCCSAATTRLEVLASNMVMLKIRRVAVQRQQDWRCWPATW